MSSPRVRYVAFWQTDTDVIIALCDQLGGSHWHWTIERGPGRHGVSNASCRDLRDPDGHRLDLYTYTADYWTGDPDLEPIRWSVTDNRRRSFWGHPVPESRYRESSLVVGLDGQPVEVVEPPAAEIHRELVPQ